MTSRMEKKVRTGLGTAMFVLPLITMFGFALGLKGLLIVLGIILYISLGTFLLYTGSWE